MLALLDVLLPRWCLACSARIAGELVPFELCRGCAAELPWHDRRGGCARCGEPVPAGNSCGRCVVEPPPWERLHALWSYEPPARDVVHGFKFRRLDYLGEAMGEALGARIRGAAHGAPEAPDSITPMPIPWPRRLVRGFNQAELLAAGLSRTLRLPVRRALRRRALFRRQTGLGRAERMRLARDPWRRPDGGFEIVPFGRVSGRRILLVDDVLTTGATAAAASHVLLAAGAARVDLAVAARTPAGPRSGVGPAAAESEFHSPGKGV